MATIWIIILVIAFALCWFAVVIGVMSKIKRSLRDMRSMPRPPDNPDVHGVTPVLGNNRLKKSANPLFPSHLEPSIPDILNRQFSPDSGASHSTFDSGSSGSTSSDSGCSSSSSDSGGSGCG